MTKLTRSKKRNERRGTSKWSGKKFRPTPRPVKWTFLNLCFRFFTYWKLCHITLHRNWFQTDIIKHYYIVINDHIYEEKRYLAKIEKIFSSWIVLLNCYVEINKLPFLPIKMKKKKKLNFRFVNKRISSYREIEQINERKTTSNNSYSLSAMLFLFIHTSSSLPLSFFNIHWFEEHTRVVILFWTNSIDYNSAGWFISRSLLVLFEKKKKKIEKPWLLCRVCLYEESKNGKSGSYGKSWIEAYRLLYNVTNTTALCFPFFFADCESVFSFFSFFLEGS